MPELSWDVIVTLTVQELSWDIMPQPQHTPCQSYYDVLGYSAKGCGRAMRLYRKIVPGVSEAVMSRYRPGTARVTIISWDSSGIVIVIMMSRDTLPWGVVGCGIISQDSPGTIIVTMTTLDSPLLK